MNKVVQIQDVVSHFCISVSDHNLWSGSHKQGTKPNMARSDTKSNSPALVRDTPAHGSNTKTMTPKGDNEETRCIRQTLQRWQTFASAVEPVESTETTPQVSRLDGYETWWVAEQLPCPSVPYRRANRRLRRPDPCCHRHRPVQTLQAATVPAVLTAALCAISDD
jgi:hypothetical protein